MHRNSDEFMKYDGGEAYKQASSLRDIEPRMWVSEQCCDEDPRTYLTPIIIV